MRSYAPRCLIVLGAATACLGASFSSCQFGDAEDGLGSPSFISELTIRDAAGAIRSTFDAGESIELRLTVRNRLNTAATIEFPTARTSDFLVVRASSTLLVWKWSTGRAFAEVPTELQFEPGETRTFSVIWDQSATDGTQVAAGDYEARGALVYEDFDETPLRSDQLASTLEPFTIR